jgi:membrane-bound ClpP family serine protease
MTPAFGLLSLLLCSLYDRQRFALLRWKVVQHQVLMWFGTIAAIYLLFRFIEKGIIKPEAAGPTATILIALSIYMAGITFDWRLILIALLLSAMAVAALFLERVLVLVLGILLTLGIAYVLLRPVIKGWRSTPDPSMPTAPASSEVASRFS